MEGNKIIALISLMCLLALASGVPSALAAEQTQGNAKKIEGTWFGKLDAVSGAFTCVPTKDASGLSFGDRKQTQPPRLDDDLVRLGTKGIQVFIVKEDLGRRGITDADLVPGTKSVPRADLPKLFEGYGQIWHW